MRVNNLALLLAASTQAKKCSDVLRMQPYTVLRLVLSKGCVRLADVQAAMCVGDECLEHQGTVLACMSIAVALVC